jgi:hypothetical protein
VFSSLNFYDITRLFEHKVNIRVILVNWVTVLKYLMISRVSAEQLPAFQLTLEEMYSLLIRTPNMSADQCWTQILLTKYLRWIWSVT